MINSLGSNTYTHFRVGTLDQYHFKLDKDVIRHVNTESPRIDRKGLLGRS